MARKKAQPTQSLDRVQGILTTLHTYIKGKTKYDERYIENDTWYRGQHWDLLRKKANDGEPEPTSAFLHNTLANRHGDLMDAYPEPVMTEREESDKQEAETLTKVVKVAFERNGFRKTYSRNAWSKCKAGTACYYIGRDQDLEGGLGDISIKPVDLLRLYWEPGIDNIQDSPYVFALSLSPVKQLQKKYPDLQGKDLSSTIKLARYASEDPPDLANKALVVDCYYKDEDGKVRLMTIIGDTIVQETEGPLYDHGKYPFVFDILFPEEHSLLGFGLVDIIKSPQAYIDKMDQILTYNALVAGRYRILLKDGGSIDVEKLADVSQSIIPVQGGVQKGVDWEVLQADALPPTVLEHRSRKIQELKEVSGANDVSRGASTSGVTAASAIIALQEAGNKLARAMIATTYDAYTDLCVMAIELIAQFYTEPRKFRIVGESKDDVEYIEYNNAGLQPQPIAPAVEGMPPETRKPIIDVMPHAEKYTPFASLAQNEMAKELFAAGFFQPEMAAAALTALDMMSFDGKDALVTKVRQRYEEAMGLQQAQAEAQKNQEIMMQMDQLIQKLTGKSMLAGTNLGQPQEAPV